MKRNTPENFWKFVLKKKRGCWQWNGAVSSNKYGSFSLVNKKISAHRLAYQLTVGPILHGRHVLHSCDNTLCVNPRHLWLGTASENMKDMVKKGRNKCLKGSRVWCSKLTKNKVVEIRKKYSSGFYSQRILAKLFNVSQNTIMRIVNNEQWKLI